MRFALLVALGVGLGVGACTASASLQSTPAPAAGEPAKTADGGASDAGRESSDETPPTAAPDPGTKPDDRPSPTAPTTVRTCDTALTAPVPLRKSNLIVRTTPIALGAAVVDGAASASVLWATGTPTPPSFSGSTSASGAGADQDADSLLYFMGQPAADEPDLFTNHLGGKSAFQTWAAALAPTARRLTYASGAHETLGAYSLDPVTRTSNAPTEGTWVRFIEPTRTEVFALAVTFRSDCALGAMSDLLGRRPLVGQPLGLRSGTILDPDLRLKIQDLLVRDGTELMLAVVRLKHGASVDTLMSTTTCGPTDLAACESALDKLGAAWARDPDAGLPDYAALSSATDPLWSVTTYKAANLSILP